MKTIKDINIEGKKVIIRCDFNVPIKDGKIIDDTRIKASLKTINYCLEHNAKVILLSHLGRVKEEADLKKNDLAPVATRLSELLDKKVTFVSVTTGQTVEDAVSNMKEKDIVLLQNTRYEDLDGKRKVLMMKNLVNTGLPLVTYLLMMPLVQYIELMLQTLASQPIYQKHQQ